ncbi:hypothetical protein LEP1GSC008_4351 [Leptospira kirschneri serovar Bulgarica str. Nikolaevo]|uniref:Uncharacterized protein n=1 Tax=Leptospira kirschneri serovar Bulgarica str. Nikolaevo TaxID=1240687 RepID=M6F669_9LEPT|nr:hypothetical protein LEP1GSC008_4351 [Leptospira kirschneri serovar Bulgarica str. Nikolaevo]
MSGRKIKTLTNNSFSLNLEFYAAAELHPLKRHSNFVY